jgi:3-phosphoshikimate 1-carboxyvinyltransferase
VRVGGAEIPRLVDEVPVLAVAAAMARGTSRFTEVGDLRNKESDRIRATCAMLRALGVETEEEPDGFSVHGTGALAGGRVEGHDDHRICMAARVAGCVARGDVSVDHDEMVATSDPTFFQLLNTLQGGGR